MDIIFSSHRDKSSVSFIIYPFQLNKKAVKNFLMKLLVILIISSHMKYIKMKKSSHGSLLVDHIYDGKLRVDNMA